MEPYHGFLLKSTFRTGLRALPSREAMLTSMGVTPRDDASSVSSPDRSMAAEDLSDEQRRAACLAELRECSRATQAVTDYVQAVLDELGLRDDRRL